MGDGDRNRRGKELWIVMELCAAKSLQSVMKAFGRGLSDAELACALRQTVRALAYVHAQRRIHRDLKSGNLLLQADGRVKLCDFGVAGELTGDAKRHTMIGSPYWMAPEVIDDAGHDQSADIWSLGITAIELAELDPPHFDVPQMRVVFLIPSSPPPRLQHSERYAPALSDLIARCLTKDPDQRPSARDLLALPYIAGAEHCVHSSLCATAPDAPATDVVPCSLAALAVEAAAAATAGSPSAGSDAEGKGSTSGSTSSSSSCSGSSLTGSLELSASSGASSSSSSSSASSSSYSSVSSSRASSEAGEERRQDAEGVRESTGDVSLAALAQALSLDGIPGLDTFPGPEAVPGAARSPAECAACQALKQRVAALEHEIAELTQQQLALVQECATYKGQIGILEQFASFAKK